MPEVPRTAYHRGKQVERRGEGPGRSTEPCVAQLPLDCDPDLQLSLLSFQRATKNKKFDVLAEEQDKGPSDRLPPKETGGRTEGGARKQHRAQGRLATL